MLPVFVFGTLKAGFPNFSLNAGIRIPGKFVTVHRYPLYLVGARYSPWLVLSEGEGFHIHGQVFEVDAAALKTMDRLERIDDGDGYRRVVIPVAAADTGEKRLVYVYGKPPGLLDGAKIQQGPINAYERKHCLLYRKRSSHGRFDGSHRDQCCE